MALVMRSGRSLERLIDVVTTHYRDNQSVLEKAVEAIRSMVPVLSLGDNIDELNSVIHDLEVLIEAAKKASPTPIGTSEAEILAALQDIQKTAISEFKANNIEQVQRNLRDQRVDVMELVVASITMYPTDTEYLKEVAKIFDELKPGYDHTWSAWTYNDVSKALHEAIDHPSSTPTVPSGFKLAHYMGKQQQELL